jgi:hypothetical protein
MENKMIFLVFFFSTWVAISTQKFEMEKHFHEKNLLGLK